MEGSGKTGRLREEERRREGMEEEEKIRKIGRGRERRGKRR